VSRVGKAEARLSRGRADPFGLLVLAVLFALTVTIGIQSQVTATTGGGFTAPLTVLSGFFPASADSNG
jgi:hypothetical protein